MVAVPELGMALPRADGFPNFAGQIEVDSL
jgi:hypothetical protein